jgi:hypothetical protein
MTMLGFPCPVCRRAGGAFTIHEAGGPLRHLCSRECARIFIMRKPDFAPDERAAALAGGDAAGAYLESIGKTDLATMTGPEWAEFCARLAKGYCDALANAADDAVPF